MILVAVGMVGVVALIQFRRAGTPPEPWRPSRALVTGGIYRYTRNPMYVGMTLIYLGVTAWWNTWWPLGVLPLVLVIMTVAVIGREEAYLERLFGEEYRRYRDRVRRWI